MVMDYGGRERPDYEDWIDCLMCTAKNKSPLDTALNLIDTETEEGVCPISGLPPSEVREGLVCEILEIEMEIESYSLFRFLLPYEELIDD